MAITEAKPPLPPFTRDTAAQKVQAAEDAWNTRDPERVAQAYTVDSVWRNRDVFATRRDEIVEFLTLVYGARCRLRDERVSLHLGVTTP